MASKFYARYQEQTIKSSHAEGKITKSNFTRRHNKAMQESALYKAMYQTCESLDKPNHWASDLDIDRESYTHRDNSLPILFGVRECGTEVIRLELTEEERQLCHEVYEPRKYLDSIHRNLGNAVWFYWHGGEMLPVTRRQAELITDECELRKQVA